MDTNIIFQIAILIMSVIIHEVSHGATALAFGDRTAEYEGRLTLNPIKHIDIIGSILLPLFLFLTKAGFMIGWAKPVPYNPYNLKKPRITEPLVAFAGPLSNIFIACVFGIIIRVMVSASISSPLIVIFGYIVLVNISLAIFNLLPIPPLDGSKIISILLPEKIRYRFLNISGRYGFFIIVAVIIFLPDFISPIILSLFHLITGI